VSRPFNFSAGPAVLPLSVLKKAQSELLSVADTGLSVLEISHRSKAFEHIIEEAEARLRRLLAIPSDYHVLFLQGGASLQFSMLALNFFKSRVAYVDCGAWAEKALKEAQKLATTADKTVEVLWSGKVENYTYMPTELPYGDLSANTDYVHITSNETIQGVAIAQDYQRQSTPVFCDMSSDILSRPVDISQYDLIYAGAQKNMGPAGVTVVILKDSLLAQTNPGLPTMLDYRTHVDKASLYNTPPVFSIYMLNLVCQWLEEQGGLKAMHSQNRKQSDMLYALLDAHPDFYRGHARPDSRSLMNITFTLPNTELEKIFLAEAEKQQLMSLKGHRSVGGIRASLYNACPDEAVVALATFMQAFYQQHH
jgi:phosphoserine aminotransferase